MTSSAATPGVWRRLALPLTVTLLVQICQNVALLSVAVLAPLIAPDLGVPVAWSGLFIGLAYLAGAVTSSQSGRLLALMGPMTGSLLALAANAVALGVAANGGLAAFAFAAVAIGFAYGLTTPTSSEILVATTPPSLYGRVFSIKQTAVPGGGFIAGLTAPSLAAWLGWQGALELLALVALGLLLAFLPLRQRFDRVRRVGQKAPTSPLALVLHRPALRRLALVGFCLSGAQLTVSTFFTPYLVEAVGLSLVTAGALFGTLQLMGVPGRVLWGWIADARLGLGRAVAVLAALTTIGLLLLVVSGPAWPVAAFTALAVFLGLGVMSWTGLFIAAAVAAAPEQASAASAGVMIFTFAGVVLVPPLVGLVVAGTGAYAPGLAIAAFMGAMALLLMGTGGRIGKGDDDGGA